jgi:hypothetical protein
MKNRAIDVARTALGLVMLTGATLVFSAPPVAAQATRPDARWDAWVGCWQPAGVRPGTHPALLCVVPAAGQSAVDVVTVTDGKETAREHIDATGARVPDTRDGCTGWRSAAWSRDGARVYLHADYTCSNGVHRASTGLIAMSADGMWLDVQGVTAGRNTGVRVLVYGEAADPGTLPADVASAVGDGSMAGAAARVADSAPLNTDDIIEASDHLDAPVVEAWLINRGEQMSVDAKELVTLASAGVPGGVTDVMVALANPDKFSLARADGSTTGAPAVAASQSAAARETGLPACPYSMYGWDDAGGCSYSPYYAYGAWGYPPYGYCSPYAVYACDLYSSYYGYGYGSPYGYGYGGYGGYYPGSQPVIVVVNQPGSTAGTGHLVKGRGYVSGSPGTGGAHPAGAAGARTQGASQSPRASGSASAGSSSGGARTAHRTGGGGGI